MLKAKFLLIYSTVFSLPMIAHKLFIYMLLKIQRLTFTDLFEVCKSWKNTNNLEKLHSLVFCKRLNPPALCLFIDF